jgi:outer membrane protease
LGFVIMVSAPGFGLDREKYEFTLGLGSGLYYGTSHEISYQGGRSDQYLSELQWEIKPLFLVHLNASLGPRKTYRRRAFFADLDVGIGVPAETGVMEDRDWLPNSTVPGSLSLFSSHENHTKIAVTAGGSSGISFPLGSWFFIRPLIALDYMYFKWEGRNGYLQYGPSSSDLNNVDRPDNKPWNPSWPRSSIAGKGITFEQHWFILSPGVRFGFNLNALSLECSFRITPLVFCYSVDNHHLRGLVFREFMFFGIYLEPQLKLGYDLGRVRLEGFAAYRYISETRGFAKSADADGTYYHGYVAGAAFRAFRGGLTASYVF